MIFMSDKVEEYLKNAEKIGRQYGNCKELKKLCKEAYQGAQKGFISKHDYHKIYVLCMSYAYPR